MSSRFLQVDLSYPSIFQGYSEDHSSGPDAVLMYMWHSHHQPVFGGKVPGEHAHASELHQLLPAVPGLHGGAGVSIWYVKCGGHLLHKCS